MSIVKSLKILVAATALAAFLAPTLSVGDAIAQASKSTVAKKTDQKKPVKKTVAKKAPKKSQKDANKASAKKTTKKAPAKKQQQPA